MMLVVLVLVLCLVGLPCETIARTILWSASSGLLPWEESVPEADRFQVLGVAGFATLTPQVLHVADVTVPDRIVATRTEPFGSEWSFQIDARVISSQRPEPNMAFSSSVHDGAKQVSLGVAPTAVGFVGANGASWVGNTTYVMNTTDVVHRYDVQKVGPTVRLFIDGSATPALEFPLTLFVDSVTESVGLLATSIIGTSEFEVERFQASTGVSVTSAPAILDGEALRAAPNPFDPSTSITFRLDVTGAVELDVFDVRGRRVRQLLRSVEGPGRFEVPWDGRDDAGQSVAAGSYWVRLSANGESRTQRLVRVR